MVTKAASMQINFGMAGSPVVLLLLETNSNDALRCRAWTC